MAVTATGSATQAYAAEQTRTPRTDRGLSTLKSEDFFKILVTELQQQDPLNPSETSDMISNVSQIRNIELSGKLSDSLDAIARQQRTAGTSELIGKYVAATSTGIDGVPIAKAGVVTGVRFNSDGVAILELDSGDSILASEVTEITSLEQIEKLKAEDTSLFKLNIFDSDRSSEKSSGSKTRRTPLKALGSLFHL